MKTLNFDTGVVTYSLNDACEISINPTDSAFIKRLADVFEDIDRKDAEYKVAFSGAKDRELFDLCEKRNTETRAMIDQAFGVPVCDAIFGGMDVFALANGLPVWSNLFFAVLDELDASVLKERSKTNPRLKKYADKYNI